MITGYSGFVGSHLVDFIRTEFEEKFSIYCLGRKEPSFPHSGWFKADLNRPEDVSFSGDFDRVFHFASALPGGSKPDFLNVNVKATKRILELLNGDTKSFLYASTGGVYQKMNQPISENDPLIGANSVDEYAKSKLEAERIIRAHSSGRFAVHICRLFFPYGLGQSKNRLIPGLAHKINTNEKIVLKGRGQMLLNPIFIQDLASALYKTLGIDNSFTLNFAGPEIVSLNEIVQTISGTLGKKALAEYAEENGGNLVGDISRMQRILGFSPVVGINEGIRRTFGNG